MKNEKAKNSNFLQSLSKPQKWLIFFFLPLILFSIMPIVIVLIIGLLPTITVLITDSKNTSKLTIIGCFNLAGIFIYLFDVIQEFNMNGAFSILGNIFNLIIMLGSAAVGVIVYHEMPNIFNTFYRASIKKQLKNIDNQLDKIRENWGDGIVVQQTTPDAPMSNAKPIKKQTPKKA